MRRFTKIANLSMGDTCETDILLLRMTQRTTRTTGCPYVELLLSDGSDVVTARKFNTRVEDLEALGVISEKVVRVVLTVDSYMGHPNYLICDIWAERYPPEYVGQFIPIANIDINQSFNKLLALIRLNTGPFTDIYAPVGMLAEQVLIDNRTAFCHSAGGFSRHHSRIGGLLEHSLGVAIEASRFTEHHPELDAEMMVAGAALHDIGKTQELYTSPCGNITYTDKQFLGGHPVLGMNMIDESLKNSALRFDPDRVAHLKHIVGAHHGYQNARDFISPATAEAMMVQLLDSIDAALDSFNGRSQETGAYNKSVIKTEERIDSLIAAA